MNPWQQNANRENLKVLVEALTNALTLWTEMGGTIGELDSFDLASTAMTRLTLAPIDRQSVCEVSTLAIDIDIELIEGGPTHLHCLLHHASNRSEESM